MRVVCCELTPEIWARPLFRRAVACESPLFLSLYAHKANALSKRFVSCGARRLHPIRHLRSRASWLPCSWPPNSMSPVVLHFHHLCRLIRPLSVDGNAVVSTVTELTLATGQSACIPVVNCEALWPAASRASCNLRCLWY